MDHETVNIVGFILIYVLGIIVLGAIAARKNRDYMAWGLIGGLFSIPCIVILAILPPLCPKCRRPLLAMEWRRRVCPTCGFVGKLSEQAFGLLEKATKLENQGQARQAVTAYQGVIDAYPGTESAHDAQKSLDSLRARLG
jgi:hypothetical protein